MWKKKKAWSLDQLVVFSRQLSNLLESGFPLIVALELLIEQRVIVPEAGESILRQLQQGKSFSESLQCEGLPDLFVSFIHAAEEHGDYVFGLLQCESYFSSREKWLRELKQACAYPFFVLILVMVALFFMMTMVLPRFSELYVTMGIELPWITRIMLSVFDVFSYIIWLLIIAMGLILFYFFFRKWKHGVVDGWRPWAWRVPLLGSFLQYYFTHYVSIQLGSLLRSGVPLLSSLEVIGKYTPWPILYQYIEKVMERLLHGISLHQALPEDPPLFLSSFSTMVAIGEKSGRLDQSLLSLAKGTEQILKNKMDRFTRGLEPVLIFLIGCFIALTVITLFLPMLQLVHSL